MSSGPLWSTYQVLGKPRLNSETLSQNSKKEGEEEEEEKEIRKQKLVEKK